MRNATIEETWETRRVVKFKDLSPRIKPKQILPFRVNFETLGLSLAGGSGAAGIGVAIIGTNFYVR
jgi:hypothetical protein